MSETEDSFEKVEFKQTPLSSPSASDPESSDEESTNLINSDKHTDSENSDDLTSDHQQSTGEKSASTMTSPIEQVTSTQVNDLEFELPWATRDEIVGNLSQHTKLLSGLIIKETVREKMQKANADLLVALMNLPLKVDGQLRSFQRRKPAADECMNEVVLDLGWDVRLRILEALTTNHNLVLLESASVSNECKAKLIETNSDLASELLKLRSRTVEIPDNSSASKEDHLTDQTAKMSDLQKMGKAAGEELDNSKESDRKMDALQLQKTVGKSVSDQAGDLDEMFKKLRIQIDDTLSKQQELVEPKRMDVCKNETMFTFELKGVEALLAGDSTKQRASEFFYLRSIPWFFIISPHRSNGANYLAVYLNCNNVFDQNTWSVMTTFEVRLLSTNLGCNDMVATAKDRPFKSSDPLPSWGWPRFISVDRLRTGSFIQNDTIKIQVHLTLKSFERIGHFVKV